MSRLVRMFALFIGSWWGLSFAQTSLLGPTGLVKIPSADSLHFLDFAVSFHAFREKLPSGARRNHTIIAGTVGLKSGLEVGLSRLEEQGMTGDYLLHGKWQIREETDGSPAVAVGTLFFPGNRKKRTFSDFSAYAVASQKLAFPKPLAKAFSLRGHVGIGSGFYRGAFYGVDFDFTKELRFSVEYDSHQLNARTSFFIAPGIALQGTLEKEDFGIGLQVIVKK